MHFEVPHEACRAVLVMNTLFMMEFTNSRSKSCEFPLRLFRLTRNWRKKSPTHRTWNPHSASSMFEFRPRLKENFRLCLSIVRVAVALHHQCCHRIGFETEDRERERERERPSNANRRTCRMTAKPRRMWEVLLSEK